MLARLTLRSSAALALAVLALAGCGGNDTDTAAPSTSSSTSASAGDTAATGDAPASEAPAAEGCIPADVTDAGIPLVSGEPVCDLVRGTLADGDLSIVIKVPSVKVGFAAAVGALTNAGYTAGITSPDGSNFTDGTYTVLLTVAEQAPYGAVATYAISAA